MLRHEFPGACVMASGESLSMHSSVRFSAHEAYSICAIRRIGSMFGMWKVYSG